MRITITGRHIELRKDLKNYVRKRFSKWATFLAADTEVHVILGVEGYRHTVEVNANDGRYAVTGKQTTKDMYQSIDLLAEKVARQLVRQHEKLTDNKAGAARPVRVATVSQKKKVQAEEPEIIVESFAGKPMTAEEAALQLQSTRQPFLVFEDVDSGQLAVMSKRKDGGFKLIIKD